MKTHLLLSLAFAAQLCVPLRTALAHPGSGIVVDEQGNVYFNGGRGLGKIDPQGKLTYVGNRAGGHWLCLDADGSFSRSQPKYFERVTPDGAKPALIFADGGSPIAVLRDGLLYYASGDETMTPGAPTGHTSVAQWRDFHFSAGRDKDHRGAGAGHHRIGSRAER